MTMYMNQYQEQAIKTAIFPDSTRNEALSYLTMGLCGEAGEVANKIKKCIRDGNDYTGISEELGDVLWYVAVLARYLEWDTAKSLEEIAAANLYKLDQRAKNGTLQGSGDNR